MDRSHDLKKIHDQQIPFLGSKGFQLDFRLHKVYFFWAQHKILHQIKPKNIKIGQYFTRKWKISQKFVWELPDGICSWSPKINRIDWGPNQSLIQKEKSLSWMERVEVGSQTFRGRRQVTEIFFSYKSVFLR
jgi:hypothetical protein